MRKFLLSAFLVLLLFPVFTLAQRDSSRNDFVNAESWFLFEDYNEAEFIYQKLLKWDPENDNLKYKIGICLLKDPYRKEQSIDYLLQASNNINPDYKESSFKERTAPPDVLYYLGNAYLVNEMLDPAIESFERFLKIMDPEVYDGELVRAQIKACENAKRLMKMPVDIDLHSMGTAVNTRYSETNPVISGDGNRMAFVTKQPFFDEALFIEKVDGEWTLPMSITSMLGFDQDIYPVALSYDGTELLLYYDDEHIGNLYLSRYENGFWLPAEKLGENITTKYWESHACFTKDGKTLYFTSNRKGTNGGLDIYKSERQPDGKWGIPENLGPTINSRYNEETPFITEDGKTLYFSSYGHFNMGGYDIFYSTKDKNGNWGEPVNLGYPINSTDDDLFFQPINNGFVGYQSRYSQSGEGRHDIYYMDIYSVNNPRMYVVTGFVRTEDGVTDLTTLEMFVIDPETGDTIKYSIPIDETGAFTLNLSQGNYALHFSGEGYEELITPLSITPGSDKEGIAMEDAIELALIQKVPLVFEGEESRIQLKDTVFEGMAGEPLIVPLKLEKGSTLIVNVFQDSSLVSSDTIEVDKRRTELEIIPLPGTSRVELEMIDSEGNIHKNTFTVIGTEPEPVAPRKEPISADEPEMAVVQPSAAGAALLLLTGLQNESEGDLKEYLEELDLEEQGIESSRELFEHLYEQSDQEGFSKRDVDVLLANTISEGDVNILYNQLLENSEGPLNEYLQGLDLVALGIDTPEELILHLEEVAEANGFTMDDVRKAMLGVVDLYAIGKMGTYVNPVDLLLFEMQNRSEGPLKEYLDDLKLENEGISTPGELIDHIYQEADQGRFSKEEVDLLLAKILSDGDLDLFYRQLLENSDGPLNEYLEGLDLEAEGIGTPEELIRHLEEVAEANGFTMDDVRNAMKKGLEHYMGARASVYGDPVGEMKLNLLRITGGPLHQLLENLDTEKEDITTNGELFKYLYLKADEFGYSKEEVDDLLANELASGDVKTLYQRLLENAEGPLKEYLEGLDLEAEGIRTPEELIRHLSEVAGENGFTMEDVREAMLRAIDKPLEVDRIYDDLLENARKLAGETGDNSLLEILKEIQLRRDGIYTVEGLINAIYDALVERGYSSREIKKMLAEMFPDHIGFIKDLVKKDGGRSSATLVLIGGISALVLLLIILWFRRRKKNE